MKKINLFKKIIMLLVVLAFSNCEEDGAIQFVIVDEFETTANISGLAAQSTFTVTNSTDVSDLLDNADAFVDAEIEKVTITLQDDYSGTSIDGTLNVTVGGVSVLNQAVVLNKGVGFDVSLTSAADILSVITSGSFPFTVTGTSTNALGDDNFSLLLSFKVKATVE